MAEKQGTDDRWDQLLSEINIRKTAVALREGIKGILVYLEGLEEWLPANYEFFSKHPDFKDDFREDSKEEVLQKIREAFQEEKEKLFPALEGLDHFANSEVVSILQVVVSQPGMDKIVTGLARSLLFFREFGAR